MATAEAKAVDTKMRNIQDRADPNQMVLGGKPDGSSRTKAELEAIPLRDANAVDEQFPTSGLVNRDNKRDELMNAKIALQGAAPGVTPFGQLIAKDSDFQWLQQKREQEEYANFQVWFAQNFDKMSPEQKKIARELFPQFYAERLQQLKRSVDLQERIARLKLLGIQDKDDMLLQYALESGYLDANPLENILHPERAALVSRQDRYVRGILNPRRLLKGDWGERKRKTNASELLSMAPGTAHQLGTGNFGFSINPGLTDVTERSAGITSNRAGIFPYMN